MDIEISTSDTLQRGEVLALYRANDWSAAKKPDALMAALKHSHSVVTARVNGRLVGLGNALSDGHLVVYYPHMLVHPDFHRKGVGRLMMQSMQRQYGGMHQQALLADGGAVGFYRALGFVRAGKTEPMWIYAGSDH